MNPVKPEFRLVRVLENGAVEDPLIVPVTAMPWDTQMPRRGALQAGVGLAAAALLLSHAQDATGQAQRTGVAPPVPPTEAPKPAPRAHAKRVTTLAVVGTDRVASGADDNTVKVWSVADAKLIATLYGHMGDVSAVAPIPGDEILASASQDGHVRIWSLADNRLLRDLPGRLQPVTALAATPDAKFLCAGYEDGTIRLWTVSDGRLFATLEGHSSTVGALVATADGRLVSASSDNSVRFWSIDSRRSLGVLSGHHTRAVTRLAANQTVVVSGSDDGTIKVWSISDMAPLLSFDAHRGGVRALALSERGDAILSAGDDGTLKISSLADGTLRNELRPTSPISAIIATSNRLVSGGRDGVIALWDAEPDRFSAYLRDPALSGSSASNKLKAHRGAITRLAISPNGDQVYSGAREAVSKVWGLPGGVLLSRLSGAADLSDGPLVPVSDTTVASPAAVVRDIVIWSQGDAPPAAPTPRRSKRPAPAKATTPSVRAAKVERTLKGHAAPVTALAVNAARTLLASGAFDGSVRLWSLVDGAPGHVLQASGTAVRHVAVAQDGLTAVSGGAGKQIRIWSTADGRLRDVVHLPAGDLGTVAVSPDGRVLAATGGKWLVMWSLEDGRPLMNSFYQGEPGSSQFTPDGRHFALGLSDGTLEIWSVETMRLVAKLEGHSQRVSAIATTPDSRRLLSVSTDRTVGIWSIDDATLVGSLHGHEADITAMALAPNGEWLVTGDASGSAIVWNLSRMELHTFLFDPAANDASQKGLSYNVFDKVTGQTISYTLPCGSPIPAGAVCTCNCVPGTYQAPSTGGTRGGGSYCTCNRVCTCVPVRIPSSERWKTNITPLTASLERVLRLRAVRFDWADNAPGDYVGADFGLIAEEVARVVPEVVAFDNDGRAEAVEYARLTALLIEAVKSQQQQIDDLRRHLAECAPQPGWDAGPGGEEHP